jgi:uncharacterized protein YdeI (YjbR/CyaY-like superfamily)
MKPIFFATQSDLRKWFEENHNKQTELLFGFYKVGSGKPSITWPQSVDEALCFGWIDGIRRSIDDESYCIRFTPRKAKSTWSAVNIKKVEELTKMGLMKPEGLAAFNKRDEANSKIYSYENEALKLARNYEKKLKGNKKAFTFFSQQAPSYQNATTRWILSAKQETTRLSRLETLIRDSEEGQLIKPMRYGRNTNSNNAK